MFKNNYPFNPTQSTLQYININRLCVQMRSHTLLSVTPVSVSFWTTFQISLFGHWVQYGKGQKSYKCTVILWTVNSQGGHVCVWLWGHNMIKLFIT